MWVTGVPGLPIAGIPGDASIVAVRAPPTYDPALLALGVLSSSTAPPLIAACAAPALAIAFWRTGAAALVIAPLAWARHGAVRPPARAVWLALAAGAALAG